MGPFPGREVRRIVAVGGGGFSEARRLTSVETHILHMPNVTRPKVCFVPTASGDADAYLLNFYRSFAAADCHLSDLPLFRRHTRDLAAFLTEQDIVYVGGGNPHHLKPIWDLHGLTDALRVAYNSGTVLAGVSAGAMCWFTRCVADTHRPAPATWAPGLGLLPGSFGPHADTDGNLMAVMSDLIQAGVVPGGYAVDDDVALCYTDEELTEVVAARPGAFAHRLALVDGTVRSERIQPRVLK